MASDEENALIAIELIERRIHVIRGQKVMLDADLAQLYGVTTGRLNEQVTRNRERFPDDFMFRLTAEEWGALRSHVAILEPVKPGGGRGQHRKYLPRVFTEQGVAMLSGVLRSPRAVQVNIAIMRTFVRLRTMLASNEKLAHKLEELEERYDGHFQIVFDALERLMDADDEDKAPIGFRSDDG